jgi:hypothetical protein
MSKSSETTNSFDLLGYPNQTFDHGYYTAQARPGIGVCVGNMTGGTMVQFFPWPRQPDIYRDDNMHASGHDLYARFITAKATAAAAENGELFQKWPFMHSETTELLIVKCMVEEGLNQVEKMDETIQNSLADPPAGKIVE